MRTSLCIAAALSLAATATAHHNPVAYDGKRTVMISGVVASARFGFPHSRYSIDVINEDGETERWLLMTEDPRDAESLGFADELRAIRVGDEITVVGWPHKVKEREIRGHELHYPDGRVVTMRRGNYIWTEDLRRIWRLRDGQVPFPDGIGPTPDGLTPAATVIGFIEEDDAVSRIAREIVDGRAMLIGIDDGNGVEFAGVDDEFDCHTERADFRLVVRIAGLDAEQRAALGEGDNYIANFNDLLSRYWEYDVESC